MTHKFHSISLWFPTERPGLRHRIPKIRVKGRDMRGEEMNCHMEAFMLAFPALWEAEAGGFQFKSSLNNSAGA